MRNLAEPINQSRVLLGTPIPSQEDPAQNVSRETPSIVCARCGVKKPASDFVSKRKSVVQARSCQDCRGQRDSSVSSAFLALQAVISDPIQRARPGALQTMRNLAMPPAKRAAPKRTAADAGLSPSTERTRLQPTSPDQLQQRYIARRLCTEPINQPRVLLGTPIPSQEYPPPSLPRVLRVTGPTDSNHR